MLELIMLSVFVCFCIGGGITTLQSGKIKATNSSVVDGVPARIIGWLLLLAIPAGVAATLLAWYLTNSKGENFESATLLLTASPIFGCPLIAIGIGLATAHPIKKKESEKKSRPGRMVRERDQENEEDSDTAEPENAPTVSCPSCSSKLRLKQKLAPGTKIKCPRCGGSFSPWR